MTSTPTLLRPTDGGVTTHRLLVTQRDPSARTYRAIGFLSQEDSGRFAFAYLRSAVHAPWFAPLPGLSRTDVEYSSSDLFPLFAERVISPRRADRETTMTALDLGSDATPFEVLTRSGGRRVEDHIELTPVAVPDPTGRIEFDFLVHGVRYVSQEAQERISTLPVGHPLTVQHEPDNDFNPLARLVLDDGLALGYVPDPLLGVVDRMRDMSAVVLRANGPGVGFHMRLLVRLTGQIEGDAPFTGPEWASIEMAGER